MFTTPPPSLLRLTLVDGISVLVVLLSSSVMAYVFDSTTIAEMLSIYSSAIVQFSTLLLVKKIQAIFLHVNRQDKLINSYAYIYIYILLFGYLLTSELSSRSPAE